MGGRRRPGGGGRGGAGVAAQKTGGVTELFLYLNELPQKTNARCKHGDTNSHHHHPPTGPHHLLPRPPTPHTHTLGSESL